MAVDREALFVALFTRLQTNVGSLVASYSRRMAAWDDKPPAVQPALLLLKGEERMERTPGAPLIWHLMATILVYAKDDGTGSAVIDTVLNNILTAIESAMEMQPDELTAGGAMYLARPNFPPAATTLGGLCLGCELTGTTKTYLGTQGHDGMLELDVEIVAAAAGGMN